MGEKVVANEHAEHDEVVDDAFKVKGKGQPLDRKLERKVLAQDPAHTLR
jgi:hypothetical protein